MFSSIFTSKTCIHAVLAANSVIFVASLVLLLISACWTPRPGPHAYYSKFWTISASTCLVFQTAELFGFVLLSRQRGRPYRIFRLVHLSICVATGFASGVCHTIVPKPDTAIVDFLSLSQGLVGLAYCGLVVKQGTQDRSQLLDIVSVSPRTEPSPKISATILSAYKARDTPSGGWCRRFCAHRAITSFNVLLLIIHMTVLILFTAGATQLAMLYRYRNPGSLQKIRLFDGQEKNVNYFCTNVDNDTRPIIWFEADSAHGVLDFIGIQTILAQDYNRTSCSYDPPNFGWSDDLPSSFENFYSYLSPLLLALGQQDQPRVLIGWGDGATNILMHALENENTTQGLVFMDSSPDGIEWLDAQRRNDWTQEQMLDYRQTDLQSRIRLMRLILAIAIPWGLLPVFIPSDPTGYYNPATYQMYRAQSLKENMWAFQYYGLRQMAAKSIDGYLTNTAAPKGMNVKAIMTYNAGTDPSSDRFYRREKLGMLDHISGRNVTDEVIWCAGETCSLDFPVNMPAWTAHSLIALGI